MAENQDLFEANAHEKRRHSSYLVPYSYYESRIPDYFPFVPLHWHREWELNYVTDGEGIMRIGDREVEVHPGDILLIQPEVLHAIERTDAFVMIRWYSVPKCLEAVRIGVIPR